MRNRSFLWRVAGLAATVPLTLALALTFAPVDSHAQVRRILEDMGLVKKPEPPPTPPALAASFQTPPFQGFACCNLRYDGRWIGDRNYASLPLIPAGTPIEVVNYDRDKANIRIEGRPMQIGQDYGRELESLANWVNKLVVKDDPRPRIKSYPPAVQEAIREGKVTPGMTREQAIVAIGYPLPDENISLDAPMWKIYYARREPYELNFKADGGIGSVTGDESITSQVVYYPPTK